MIMISHQDESGNFTKGIFQSKNKVTSNQQVLVSHYEGSAIVDPSITKLIAK